jgi:AcrR family transcriptional regulator
VRVAAAHFAERGTAGASMSAIAREASVTRALVYHYFPGKEALLAAVMQHEGDRILEAIKPDPDLDPGQAIRWALDAYFSHVEDGGASGHDIPFVSAASASSSITESTPDVQVQWLLDCAQMPATGYTRLALTGWFALVEHTARSHAELGSTTRAQAIELCVSALGGITGQSFALDGA